MCTSCLQGWTLVVSCDMNHLYGSLPCKEQERVNRLELFDEYEEWHNKCSHYMLLYAMKGTCEKLLPLLPEQNHVATLPSTSLLLNSINVQTTEDSCVFKRWVYCCVAYTCTCILQGNLKCVPLDIALPFNSLVVVVMFLYLWCACKYIVLNHSNFCLWHPEQGNECTF